MIQIVGAALVVVTVLAVAAAALLRTERGSRGGPVAAWLTLHHVAVAVIAVSAAVALAAPPDIWGTADPSDPFGGYVGRYAFLAIVWTVLMLPVTGLARVVVTRATSPRTRTTAVVGAWVLLVATGALLAALLYWV